MSLLSFVFLLSLHAFGTVIMDLLLIPRSSIRCSAAYLIGSLAASLLFFVAVVSGLDIYRSFGLLIVIVGLATAYAWMSAGYWREVSRTVQALLPRNRSEQTLFIIILFLLCFIALMNYFWPHTDWDAITLYDYRAKLLFDVGTIAPLFKTLQDIYLTSYPWYTSVLLLLQYMMGSWNGMGLYTFLVFSLILTFYSLIISTVGRFPALLGSVALLTVPMLFAHTMIAYTNFPYMVFWGLGICCLLAWIATGKTENASIGALLIAGSLWVRQSEPFWMIAVLLLFYGAIKFRQWKVSVWFLPVILIWRGWNQYVHGILMQVLPTDSSYLATFEKGGGVLSSIFSLFDASRWVSVLEHLARYAIPIWGGWVFIALLLFVSSRRTHQRLISMATVVACIGSIVVGTYLFANNSYWREIVDSFQRLLLFAFPVFVYVTMTLLNNKESNYVQD